MPEGDTIFRTAVNLRRWLLGHSITAVPTIRPGLDRSRLVGSTVTEVESRGKHLLVRFSSGYTLHTHMRMSGAWHLYSAGERWRKPRHQARVVLEAGSRVAVCFDAPIVELLPTREEPAHPALARLGQDLAADGPLDLAEVRSRARLHAADAPTIGELLQDQRVVAGIGNIYRSETLFLCGIDPRTSVASIEDDDLDRLVTTAARLLKANATATTGTSLGRAFHDRPDRRWVYRRAGRPCRRCRTIIRSARHGRQARTVYWCPSCQSNPAAGQAD